MQLSDYRCPITANCPITLSDYNFTDQLVQNTVVYEPITFEEIVIIMIIIIIITHSPPLSHSKPLFLELHILNIHLIYNYQLACFVFQHINHLLPLPVSSLFQFNYHIHNYSTRHKHDLHILPHKQSFSIRTQGPKCWNALPLSLRQSLRIHNYKKILKKYYLSLINTSDL